MSFTHLFDVIQNIILEIYKKFLSIYKLSIYKNKILLIDCRFCHFSVNVWL